MRNKKGFTLIELLVVIAIIGLLSTLAVVALQNARQKSRDAKRVGDIKQIQTALDLYYADENAYPIEAAPGKVMGVDYKALCSSGFQAAAACPAGDTAYMAQIPADPQTGTQDYVYVSDGVGYTIDFSLEGTTSGLAAGPHVATEAGMQ